MMPLRFIILLLLLALPAFGKVRYVRPDGGPYGDSSGTSWGNAYNGFANVDWGGAGVDDGDTLYVGAGNYTSELNPDGIGTWYLRAAQDTHTGVAVFTQGMNVSGGDNTVHMDGSYNGATNFVFLENITGQYAVGCSYKYFLMTNAVMPLQYGASNEVGYFVIDIRGSPTQPFCINTEGSVSVTTFDQSFIHHGTMVLNGRINPETDHGKGADGIKPDDGTTITNCTLRAVHGTVSGEAENDHQDLIQAFGSQYIKIMNCHFIDSGDALVGIDIGDDGDMSNYWVINNTFRRTVLNMGGNAMLRLYSGSSYVSAYNNVRIEGNTLVDAVRSISNYRGGILIDRGDGSTTSTGCTLRNNLLYNCGGDMHPISAGGVTANWTVENNLIDAGASGTETFSWTGASNVNGQNGTPSFVAYTAFSPTSDLRLASGDTAAKDLGAPGLYAFDADGVARPQGGGWDIGAYEYEAGEADTTDPTVTITTPTSAATYTTASAAFTIGGTAADNVSVASVSAAMSGATSGSISISGTTTWSGSTTLSAGVTVITVTATDSSANTGTDTITVTYTPAAPPATGTLRFQTLRAVNLRKGQP